MANSNKRTFHSDFQRVTICADGVPLSLNAEVAVELTKPAKLDKQSREAWDRLKGAQSITVTAENVPGGGGEA